MCRERERERERVIVTGASDGLGKAFARLCLDEGIEVIALSRSAPNLEGNCIHIATDLRNETSIKNSADLILKDYPKFDALVNCAGITSSQEPNNISYSELEDVYKVNVLAPIYLTSCLFEAIKENGADVLNVGSTVGTGAITHNNECTYSSSKWALRGVSSSFNFELIRTKCRVIQFNPGGMNTRIFEKYDGTVLDDPQKLMDPRDVADVMLYTLKLPRSLHVSEITVNRKFWPK